MSLVLVEEKKIESSSDYWCFLTLNSESTLNSLSLEMIGELVPALKKAQNDNSCVGVFLQGAGEKAFCAGGDIKRLYQALKARKDDPHSKDNYPEEFFENEYSLDYFIHTFPKPFIAFGHGIVMGGGLGLLSGASVKVATESTKIAMPEITIGLFPDVGATYFLNKAPGSCGLFLGLTGARLSPSDCLYAKLCDVLVKREHKESFIQALLKITYSKNKTEDLKKIRECLSNFETKDVSESNLKKHQDFINTILRPEKFSLVLEKFKELQTHSDKWISEAAKNLLKGCPTSAFVIWEQLKNGKGLDLKSCFNRELSIAINICKFSNFREGVRALLIDKDNAPQWEPASFEAVTEAFVAQHFASAKKEIRELA